jgi:hypothetical protein
VKEKLENFENEIDARQVKQAYHLISFEKARSGLLKLRRIKEIMAKESEENYRKERQKELKEEKELLKKRISKGKMLTNNLNSY